MSRCVSTISRALVMLLCGLQLGKAQQYGQNALTAISAYLDGIFPSTEPGLREFFGEGAYYFELASGQHEGHRFDIDLAGITDQVVSLDLRGAHNTLSALPTSGLRFSQAIIRPHRLLGEVYPISRFQGSNDPASTDQVQFFNGVAYDSYYLLDAGGRRYWVASEDTDLADAHHVVIPPGE